LLDGLTAITIENNVATRYEDWCGQCPDFANYLGTWGEAGTVKIKNIGTPKLADQGVQCMFVGYALDHTGNCYQMWDPTTKRVHETRDVIWLKCMFYEKPVTTPKVIVIPSEDVEEPGIKAGEGDGQLNDAKADEAKADEDEDVKNAEESVVEQESVEENVAIEDIVEY